MGFSLGFGLMLATLAEAVGMGNANLSGGLYAARPATPTVGMIYAATDRLLLSVCITAGSWLELVGGPRTGTLAARGSAATYIGSLYRVTSGDGSGDLYASDGTDWALVSVSRRLPRDAAVLHRWTLDEGTGVSFADTGTANDTLTLAGSGVVVDGAGTVGCGLRFTGTSALASTSASPATPNPGAFSVALTLRMDIQTGDQYPMVKLVTPGAWTPLEAAFAVKLEWGTLFIGHNVGGWQVHACTSVPLATGALYRVLAVFDGAVWRVYLNGVLIDTWAAVGTVNWGTGEWVLGGIPTVSVPFHGLVDEVDVHDAVLSPAQAVEDYLRAFNLWSVGGDSGGGGGGGGGGATHGSGTLAARPASPSAGDTYAVTSGTQTGARYTCFVAGSWEASMPVYTADHIYNRVSPSSAGGGAVFLDEDTRQEYVSSGDDTIGWSVRLPTRLGAEKCGLTMGSGSIRQVQDLTAFTVGHVTLAVTFHWDGDTSGDFYGFCALGQRSGVGGVPTVGLKANGAGFDLAVYRGGSTFEVLKNYAAKSDFAVGVHALAIAAVTVEGTDYWRFSIDGSAVADVAIAGGYVTPSATSAVSLGCTDAPDSPLHGTAYELAAWTSTLSNASLVALSTPPTSTHALAISSTTGVPQIYVQARRYDPSFPTVLPALGVPANMACSSVTRLDY